MVLTLDLCSQPELLVVLQLNAATLFSSTTSRCRTLSCRSDRSCTPHTSYIGRRCLILTVLLGEFKVTGIGSDPPVIRACHSFLGSDDQ